MRGLWYACRVPWLEKAVLCSQHVPPSCACGTVVCMPQAKVRQGSLSSIVELSFCVVPLTLCRCVAVSLCHCVTVSLSLCTYRLGLTGATLG